MKPKKSYNSYTTYFVTTFLELLILLKLHHPSKSYLITHSIRIYPSIENSPNVSRTYLHNSDSCLVTSDQHHLVSGQAVHHVQASWQADCKFLGFEISHCHVGSCKSFKLEVKI